MPRSGTRAVPDLDDLFSTSGFLRDSNADGYTDDLRACVVLAEEPDAETWCALLDLAARLGLETSGISFPLVSDAPADDRVPIVVRNGRATLPAIEANGWHGRAAVSADGPAAIRALARLGQADRRDGQARRDASALEGFDLARLFETDGLLLADHDLLPSGTRLSIVVPAQMPRAIGIGLFHLVARLGMESGGIDLPIATTGAVRASTVPLRIRPKSGYLARLSVVTDDQGPALELIGDARHAGDLLDRLARRWPYPPGDNHPRAMHDAEDWLRRSLAGWTPEGRLASLLAELRPIESGNQPDTIRLFAATHDERQAQANIVRRVLGKDVALLGPGSTQRVFAQEWSARWEVDRALDVLRDRIIPRIIRGLPFRLIVLVSEPRQVRERLRADALLLLAEAGMRPEHCDLIVLDAFKAGLCWLREVVLPSWSDIAGIERVVISYRPLEIPTGEQGLELRIRWLQELFPADEIVAKTLGLPLDRVRLTEWGGDALYRAEALSADGAVLGAAQFSPLTYRRPYLGPYPAAGIVHVVTGGVIVEQVGQTISERVPTDLDLFWDYYQGEVLPRLRGAILDTTEQQPRRADQPFFSELRVEVTISEIDESFGIREERNSAAEALHEDIYFNTLDMVEMLGEHTTGDRLNAPGAVLPFVHVRTGVAPSARVSLLSRPRWVAQLERAEGSERVGKIDGGLCSRAVIDGVSILHARAQIQLRLDGVDDRALRRLQALSEICPTDKQYPALVVTAQNGTQVALEPPDPPDPPSVHPADSPVPDGQIVNEDRLRAHLQRLTRSRHVDVRLNPALDWSWAGRPIPAVEVVSPMKADVWSARKLSLFKPTFLIVARHHANEVASTTAALQLIEHLVEEPEWRRLAMRLNLAILPFENPDGAALHDLLQREHPSWKHHPARYNAVGFEFGEDTANPNTPYGEARVRDRLWQRWLPDVVVDNHGVPSHEWAQIFAGFGSPPRFTVSYWLVQALVYGIIPYLDGPDFPEHRAAAVALRDAVARAAASDAEILELNRRYRERYLTWGTSRVPERFPADVYREMIFSFGPLPAERLRTRPGYAARYPTTTVVSWVSEVADETATGAQLRRTARAHLLANRATMELLAAAATPPERRILTGPSGTRITLGRRRPIRLGP